MNRSFRDKILSFFHKLIGRTIQLTNNFLSLFPVLKNISIEIIIDRLRTTRGIVLSDEVNGLVSSVLEAQSEKIYSDTVTEFNSQLGKTLTVILHNGHLDESTQKLKSELGDSGLAFELVESSICNHVKNVDSKKNQNPLWFIELLTRKPQWDSIVFIKAIDYPFFQIADVKRIHIENLSGLNSFVSSFRIVQSVTDQSSVDYEVFKTLDAKYIDSRMWGFSKRFLDYFDLQSKELAGTLTHLISVVSLRMMDLGLSIRQVPVQVNQDLLRNLRLDIGCELCWQKLSENHTDLKLMRRRVLPETQLPPVNISLPKNRKKKRLLFVQPISGGGLPATTSLLAKELEKDFEIYYLVCQQKRFRLFMGADLSKQLVDFELRQAVDPLSHRSSDYDYLFSVVLGLLEIDIVQVEHLAWQSLGIAEICDFLGVPFFYTFHDYYAVCASHNLLDENLKFCGGVCTKGSGFCQTSLWPKYDLVDLKNGTIHRWQRQMGLFLDSARTIFAPSSTTANDALEIFPGLNDKLVVAPHSLSVAFEKVEPKYVFPGQYLKILVIGDLGSHKGEYELRKLADQAEELEIEIHILGPERGLLQKNVVNHGEYKVIDLADKVGEIEPNVAFLPSITHETFSHALTELLSLGLPVVAFSGSGAIEERIISNGVGITLNKNENPERWVEQIKKITNDELEASKITESIRKWQLSASTKTPNFTSFVYQNIYLDFLEER